MRTAKVAICCFVIALFVTVAILVWGGLEANRTISLCWDKSAPDYIKDDKLRDATCKK